MKKAVKIFLFLVAAVVLAGSILLGIFLRNNTSLFTSSINADDVASNNFNFPRNENTNGGESENDTAIDLRTLTPRVIDVPAQYQSGVLADQKTLNVPDGFHVSLFVGGLKAPRFFDFDANNTLIVADKGAGTIVMFPDRDRDGVADESIVLDSGLRQIHSVDFYNGDLYAGEEHQVVIYRGLTSNGMYSEKQVIVPNLPAGGGVGTVAGHVTRTVVVGPDEKLYVSIGSSCNVCEEEDGRRAAIVRYNLDGSNEEIVAIGLRNAVGFVFRTNPDDGTQQLWAVDNGRDLIGDDVPPEEVNIVEAGEHYGWPYCYGKGVVGPEFPARSDFCQEETVFPVYEMQAHSAPLGVTFQPHTFSEQREGALPDVLREQLIIALHGSWNRTVPTGYKLVRIDTQSEDGATINFITGWLQEDGTAWGRPVGVGFDNGGALFISDDKAGVIYRVTYDPVGL